MIAEWELILRLIMAVVLGGLVGFQRETSERPAGFRTHVLVALGATLFTLVSAFPFNGSGKVTTDPTRIAAQVVTGIGFLGAGTIIRRENVVIGLTTAASLWAVAAVGVAVGAGYYGAAVGGTLLIFGTLTLLKRIERRFMLGFGEGSVELIATEGSRAIADASERLAEIGVSVKSASMKHITTGKSEIQLILDADQAIDEMSVMEVLGDISSVEEVNLGLFRKAGSEA